MSRRKEPVIPSDLLDQLLAGGDAAAALQQGGLLDSLKKALAERVLNAEMDHHLGQDEQAGNSRNGYGRKTVATDTGKIEIEVPRERAGSFDPQLIARYQRRFPGFDDKIIIVPDSMENWWYSRSAQPSGEVYTQSGGTYTVYDKNGDKVGDFVETTKNEATRSITTTDGGSTVKLFGGAYVGTAGCTSQTVYLKPAG
jgi:hypothetical protein